MESIRAAYLLVFGAAAAACYVGAWRATRITDSDTRAGLVALLVLSGTWAAASTARLLPVSPAMQTTAYLVGLVVGLASVGAWLYFCSAYTGHDYHRRSGIQVLAVAIFLVVVSVKLTNPLHELYFSTVPVAEPFRHAQIELHATHWVVTGFAYACSAVGFYLLYELFNDSQLHTLRLGALVGVTGVPALFDVLAYTEVFPSVLLKFNYEPVGVAVFAVGTLFVVDETFVAVPRFWRRRVLEQLNEAIVVVDREDRIRDHNDAAAEMFPNVADGIGGSLAHAAPLLARADESDGDVIEIERDGEGLFYRVRTTRFTLGSQTGGRAFICTDVTDIERQRRDLRRQTDQFDDFAEAITHELRNTLTVLDGYLDLVADAIENGDRPTESVPIRQVNEAADRMQAVIADLTTLARHGQPLDNVGECDLGAAVEAGWTSHGDDGTTYEVTSAGRVAAERIRLEELFRNVSAFAEANGASRVSIALDGDAITITDDGGSLDEASSEKAFSYGEPVPTADAGMSLPNVRAIARAHGWSTSVDTSYRDGARIRIEDVDVLDGEAG